MGRMKYGGWILPLVFLAACDKSGDPWLGNARKFEAEGNYLGALDAYKKSKAYLEGDFEVARQVDALEKFRPDFEQARQYEQQVSTDPRAAKKRYASVFSSHTLKMPSSLRARLDGRIADRAAEADRALSELE